MKEHMASHWPLTYFGNQIIYITARRHVSEPFHNEAHGQKKEVDYDHAGSCCDQGTACDDSDNSAFILLLIAIIPLPKKP